MASEHKQGPRTRICNIYRDYFVIPEIGIIENVVHIALVAFAQMEIQQNLALSSNIVRQFSIIPAGFPVSNAKRTPFEERVHVIGIHFHDPHENYGFAWKTEMGHGFTAVHIKISQAAGALQLDRTGKLNHVATAKQAGMKSE